MESKTLLQSWCGCLAFTKCPSVSLSPCVPHCENLLCCFLCQNMLRILQLCVEVREKPSCRAVPTWHSSMGRAGLSSLEPSVPCPQDAVWALPVWVQCSCCGVAVLGASLTQPPHPRYSLCVLCRDEKWWRTEANVVSCFPAAGVVKVMLSQRQRAHAVTCGRRQKGSN